MSSRLTDFSATDSIGNRIYSGVGGQVSVLRVSDAEVFQHI